MNIDMTLWRDNVQHKNAYFWKQHNKQIIEIVLFVYTTTSYIPSIADKIKPLAKYTNIQRCFSFHKNMFKVQQFSFHASQTARLLTEEVSWINNAPSTVRARHFFSLLYKFYINNLVSFFQLYAKTTLVTKHSTLFKAYSSLRWNDEHFIRANSV